MHWKISKQNILRLGGWIQTTKSDDGFTFEHGPRTVRPAGPQGANTLELVEDLELGDVSEFAGLDELDELDCTLTGPDELDCGNILVILTN